jgi:phosphonate transport system substrate-binding protein
MTNPTLRFTSCQAPIAESAFRSVVTYLADRLPCAVEYLGDIPWQERMQGLDAGAIQVCWLCGLQYVWRVDVPAPPLELLAAPVMAAARYQDRPVYFSDVLVAHTSPVQSFVDLRGATFAYNEPTSHSGCNVMRYHLASLGEMAGFFGRVVESGAHQASLQLLRDGVIAAAAVDTTVFQLACTQEPHLAHDLRVVATLGPSPMPPWVIHKNTPLALRTLLRTLLTTMHTDPAGLPVLQHTPWARFAPVTDPDYDPIRHMDQLAAQVRW